MPLDISICYKTALLPCLASAAFQIICTAEHGPLTHYSPACMWRLHTVPSAEKFVKLITLKRSMDSTKHLCAATKTPEKPINTCKLHFGAGKAEPEVPVSQRPPQIKILVCSSHLCRAMC
ncbi:unnamed protein product [Caretta caretta]